MRLATRSTLYDETFGLRDQSGLILIDQQGKLHTVRPFAHFKQNALDIDRGLAELLPDAK